MRVGLTLAVEPQRPAAGERVALLMQNDPLSLRMRRGRRISPLFGSAMSRLMAFEPASTMKLRVALIRPSDELARRTDRVLVVWQTLQRRPPLPASRATWLSAPPVVGGTEPVMYFWREAVDSRPTTVWVWPGKNAHAGVYFGQWYSVPVQLPPN